MRRNPNERGFDIVIIIACDEVKYIFCKEVHGQTQTHPPPPTPMGVDHGDDLIPYALKHKSII
jgi:hypothetical protein